MHKNSVDMRDLLKESKVFRGVTPPRKSRVTIEFFAMRYNCFKLRFRRRVWGILCAFFVLFACQSDDPVDPVKPKEADASKFGFTLLRITDTRTISIEAIKNQLKSESGWTIKSIEVDDKSFAEVSGTSVKDLKITLKKSGKFTASITLKKSGYLDFVLKGCEFEVVLPKFSFKRLTQGNTSASISASGILKQIDGAVASGYSLKSITITEDAGKIAKVSGTAPDLKIDLTISKKGDYTFKAKIVLTHANFFEVILENCEFVVSSKNPAPNLTFAALSRSIYGEKVITTTQILAQIAGAKSGYQLKSIVLSSTSAAQVEGKAPDLTIKIKGVGDFTATLVLAKADYLDATITNCVFKITDQKQSPVLTALPLQVVYGNNKVISTKEILGKVQGNKQGYTLKDITFSDNLYAERIGSKPNLQIRLKKAGTFTVILVLEKAGFTDVSISDFRITVSRAPAPSLEFPLLQKPFGKITAQDILDNITGAKGGYSLKSITLIDAGYGKVLGTAPGLEIQLLQTGNFRARLVLEKANYQEVNIDAAFAVVLGIAPNLTPLPLETTFDKGVIKAAAILSKINGAKTGYQITSIYLKNDAYATVSGTELRLKGTGTFTATLTLKKQHYRDISLPFTFKVRKGLAPTLGFRVLERSIAGNKTITAKEILNHVTGVGKAGYALRGITVSNTSIAQVSGTSLTIKKVGSFTASLTLQKTHYQDAVIDNCSFVISSDKASPNFTFSPLKRIFSVGGVINTAQILAQIQESQKVFYTLKSLTIDVEGQDKAEVLGSAPSFEIKLKSAGNFKAVLVLERSGYVDATISDCVFEIGRLPSPAFTFSKLGVAFGTNGNILTESVLLGRLGGGDKTGYKIQSIRLSSTDKAEVLGKTIRIKKVGRFSGTLVLEKENYKDVSVAASFEVRKGAKKSLGFRKFIRKFSDSRLITAAQILERVSGPKAGYVLESITVSDKRIVTLGGVKPDFTMAINHSGSFSANITLVHPSYGDVVLSNSEFVIEKGTVAQFGWNVFSRAFSDSNKTITKAQILSQITGVKRGYVLESIVITSGSSVAAVGGSKPDFSIGIKTAGSFKATIILVRPDYTKQQIDQCGFTINKGAKPTNLGFVEFEHSILAGNSIGAADIIKNVTGDKGGYVVKSIGSVSDGSVAAVSSSGKGLSIKKQGSFTVTLVLEKSNYQDATLTGASFRITGNQPAPSLSFNKLTRSYGGNKIITKDALLGQIPESSKAGYALKSISISKGSMAKVSGTAPDLQIDVQKAGVFTATLVLEKSGFVDATISASFEITRIAAPLDLAFGTLSAGFSGRIDAVTLLGQVTGTKTGYKLKEIVFGDSSYGSVSGTAPNLQMDLLKVGRFSATITLARENYEDAALAANFIISKGTAPSLSFDAYIGTFSSGKRITAADILGQIPQTAKAGYTLKSIASSDTNIATVTGSKPNLQINILRSGNFTADIVLEKTNYQNVTLSGASFGIGKGIARVLQFSALSMEYGSAISKDALLAQITGTKVGYSLKSITITSGVGVAEKTGTKPNLGIRIKGVGAFKATLVLEHRDYGDVTITDCSFTITPKAAPSLTFNKLKRNFASDRTITSVQLLAQIPETEKAGYTIKTITSLSDSNIAAVSGTAPSLKIDLKKAGSFTAVLTLEKAYHQNVTLNASFEVIAGLPAPVLHFSPLSRFTGESVIISNAAILGRIQGDTTGYTLKEITGLDSNIAELSGTLPNVDIVVKKPGEFSAKIVLKRNLYQDAVIDNCKFRYVFKNRTYKRSGNSAALDMVRTPDGGFVLAGYAETASGGYTSRDVWIVKLDVFGNKVWDKAFGGSDTIDEAKSILLTNDGGFVILANKSKFDGNNKGWIFKINAQGSATLWEKEIASANSGFTSLVRDTDGNFAISGYKKLGSSRQYGGWVLKLNGATRNVIFDKTYKKSSGAQGGSVLKTIIQTTGGDYLGAGFSRSGSGSLARGYLVKLNSGNGNKIWDTEYALNTISSVAKVQHSSDGGYYLGGSVVLDISAGAKAFVLLKADSSGNIGSAQSSKRFNSLNPGSNSSNANDIIKADGGYVSAGILFNRYVADSRALVVKVDEKQNLLWKRILAAPSGTSLSAASVVKGMQGGYFIAGFKKVSSESKFWISKLDANGKEAKGLSPRLTFDKFTKGYGSPITKDEILGQLRGIASDKSGYTLKAITGLDSSVATVSGTAPNLQISPLKTGTFNAILVLEKANYEDATVNATFEIQGAAAPSLTFNKLTEKVDTAIDKNTLLGQVQTTAAKAGYTLKAISGLDSSVAIVSGTKPNLQVTFKQTGTFNARLILEKPYYQDATVNATFEIQKANAPALGFTKLVRIFTGNKTITTNQILGQVTGSGKTGYTIKSITPLDASLTIGGSKPNWTITFAKAGKYTANIVLEKPYYQDVTFARAEIEINLGASPVLSFGKITQIVGTTLTAADILAQVTGTDHDQYSIKEISGLDSKVATIGGSKPNWTLTLNRGVAFTATLILERLNYADVILRNSQFKATKKAAIKLGFEAAGLVKKYPEVFTSQDILDKVTGSKTGYKVKSISLSGDVAELSGTRPTIKIVPKKVGKFTADVVVESWTYADVSLTGCKFEVQKGAALTGLSFNILTRDSEDNALISTSDIMGQVQGDLRGYTLKEISGVAALTSLAVVSGTKPNLKITFQKAGQLKPKVILEKGDYEDVVLDAIIEYVDTWEKTINKGDRGSDEFYDVVEAHGGGYVPAGSFYSTLNRSDGYALKLKGDGVKAWDRRYGGIASESFSNVFRLNNGYLLVGAHLGNREILLITLNNSGAIVSTKKVSVSSDADQIDENWFHAIRTRDGGLALALTVSNSFKNDILVLKIASNFKESWRKLINLGSDYETARGVLQATDNNLVVSTHANGSQLLKLNVTTGAQIWKKQMSSSLNLYSGIVETTGGFLLCGQKTKFSFKKVDGIGDDVWEIETNTYGAGRGIIKTRDGNFVAVGTYDPASGYVGVICKVDSTGRLLWQRTFASVKLNDVAEDSAGNLVVVGKKGNDFYIARLDRNGNKK